MVLPENTCLKSTILSIMALNISSRKNSFPYPYRRLGLPLLDRISKRCFSSLNSRFVPKSSALTASPLTPSIRDLFCDALAFNHLSQCLDVALSEGFRAMRGRIWDPHACTSGAHQSNKRQVFLRKKPTLAWSPALYKTELVLGIRNSSAAARATSTII